MTALALALALVAGQVGPGAEASAWAAYTPVVMSAPLTTSGHLPTTTTCQPSLICYPDADSWNCWDAAGASVAVTQGTGTGFEPTPYVPSPDGTARYGARIDSDAKAPRLADGSALEAIYNSDHTILYAAGAGSAGGIPLSQGSASVSGWFAQDTAAYHVCQWNRSGASVATAPAWSPARWALLGCRRSGDNFSALAPSATTTTASAGFTVAAPTGIPFWFGRYSGGGSPYAGVMALAVIYPCALTDAEYARAATQWSGALAESRNVTCDRNSTLWFDAVDGYVYAVGDDSCGVDSSGLHSWMARTNYATNSHAIDLATDVGTPTECMAAAPVNCNSTSGPFSRYVGSAEADTVGDDDGAALEGAETPSAGTATGAYMVGNYVKAGTAVDETLSIVTDGGGSASCTFTGLAVPATATCTGTGCMIVCRDHRLCSTGSGETYGGGFVRASCAATITGAPTYVRAQHLVGDAASDTGTLIIAHRMFMKGSNIGPPIVAGATATATAGDYNTISTVGWPVLEGSFEVDYIPTSGTFDAPSFVVDSRPGASTGGITILIDPTLTFYTWNGASSSVTSSAGLTWVPGQTYRLRVRWGGGNTFLFRDSVLVASLTAGTATMPAAHGSMAGFGTSFSGGCCWANGSFSNLRVSR